MTAAITVALATAAHLPSGMADTPALSVALAEAGLTVALRAWDDPAADWRRFALVVPHCTWDYLERLQDFRRWLHGCEQSGALPNSLRLLDWSTDKAYLLRLAAQGIAIVPTVRVERGRDTRAAWLWERFGSAPLVVKPAVGGGGHRVWRCADADHAAGTAAARLPAESVIIQAFQPAVTTEGEYSAVLVAGRLSHVVRKRPRQGDFRVHRRYGATRELVDVQPWMAGYCRQVLAAAPAMPLYARVDFLVPQPAEPVLMELELLEPDLYLRECPGAAARFAAALADRARQRAGRCLPGHAQVGEIQRTERDAGGGDVLLQMAEGAGAGDGQDAG